MPEPPLASAPAGGQAGAGPPAGPAAAEEQPDDPAGRGGPSTGVIVGAVLIGATLLVLGALSVPLLLQRLSSAGATSYSVGDCVVQDGLNARLADCGDAGAFEIIAEAGSREECTDPTQPAIEVAGPPAQFYCLAPANASAEGGEPTGEDADDSDQDD